MPEVNSTPAAVYRGCAISSRACWAGVTPVAPCGVTPAAGSGCPAVRHAAAAITTASARPALIIPQVCVPIVCGAILYDDPGPGTPHGQPALVGAGRDRPGKNVVAVQPGALDPS